MEKSRVRQLNQLGFAWSINEWEFEERLLPAVRLLLEAKNSLPRDPKFRINAETVRSLKWPKALLDYPVNETLLQICTGSYAWPIDKFTGIKRMLSAFREGKAAHALRNEDRKYEFKDNMNIFARLCGLHKKEFAARHSSTAKPSPATDDASDKTT